MTGKLWVLLLLFETISDIQISLCIDSILITEGKEVYGTWIYKTVF